MLDRFRAKVAALIAPPAAAKRSYASGRSSRLQSWGSASNNSADSELSASLQNLRTRSRQLMRDAPYAKRARTIVVNNVVGSGVGLQCQVKNTRGELHARINADIEAAWDKWTSADECHAGGTLAFADLERIALSEVFTAGEAFLRIHRRPFGGSAIPIGLELIEAERLADEASQPFTGPDDVRDLRMGVEVDTFGRPQAYWIRERHPGELRVGVQSATRYERVPAADIIHLRTVDRWPQTRGEPWLHAVIRKLGDMDEYSSSELIAARMSANFFATIESTEPDALATDTVAGTGQRELNIEPGVIEQLTPGDSLKFHTPNRPNTALDPFLRYMLREVAAGAGCSYESLSRDYSQSNYSSSRLALLDDRDLWRVLQQWWARSFRIPLHAQWLAAAVMAGAVPSVTMGAYWLDPRRYQAATWKFRGWSWVDPTKEVTAYKEAVKAGFMTVSKVIAITGGGDDIEDVIAERKRELQMFEDADIELDTTVAEAVDEPTPAPQSQADPASSDQPEDETPPARVLRIRESA